MSKDDFLYTWIELLQEEPENSVIQERMVNHYKGLVESLAYKYFVNYIVHEDLVQVGMIGLLKAVERFDKSFNRSFEAFAVPTILGEIKRFIRDHTWSVHVPRRVKELGPRIQRTIEELTITNQKSPTIKEIANYLNVSQEEVLETLEMRKSYHALSADHQRDADGEGGTLSIFDTQGREDERLAHVNLSLMLEGLLIKLSRREQIILKCVFYEEMSQKETASLLGISQMHVSRLQRRALKKLKENLPMSREEVFND